jgi:hypothetical protein
VQQVAPCGAGHVAPRGERALCGARRGIDVGRVARGDFREHCVVDRRAGLERGSGPRCARRAVDEMLHAAAREASCELLRLREVRVERP